MTPRTLRALSASIRKWQRIAAGRMGSDGSDNCPLCALFLDDDCRGCPVFELTRKKFCENTPYGVWEALAPNETVAADDGERINSHLSRTVAKAEASFLKALLP